MSTSQIELLAYNHGSALRNIRNFLAGRFIGATRDRALMDELLKCIFAKHWINNHPDIHGDLSEAYRHSFALVRKQYSAMFELSDELQLDPAAIRYVDDQLSSIDLENCRGDIFGEIYEVFGGSGVKVSEGQFFTPTVAIDLLMGIVKPEQNSTVCDPACGAGGFLIALAKYFHSLGLTEKQILDQLYGVEKDSYLTRLANGRIALYLDGLPNIICGDSLAGTDERGKNITFDKYDVVMTNPPFGSKIAAANEATILKYELSKKWNDEGGTYKARKERNQNTSPQILFLELCLRILKPSGKLAIILPESLVSSKSYSFVVQYLKEHADLIAVIGMPEVLFKTSGKSGTHTKTVALVAQKKPNRVTSKYVFFAEAKWCGHDSRARRISQNDLPIIISNFQEHDAKKICRYGSFGVSIGVKEVGLNLAPRRFELDISLEIQNSHKRFEFVRFGELCEKGWLEIRTGDEVGKMAYGSGQIPFVRTSDMSNWEIKADPKHRVSDEIYKKFGLQQDVRAEDILIVRDGTYLIGTAAIVTNEDIPMLYQSHIYKIRVLNKAIIDPYLLLSALSSTFVKRQIKSFCVSQDIIDSLGDKIFDIQLPIPKSSQVTLRIIRNMKEVIRKRSEAKNLSHRVLKELELQTFDAP